MNTDGPRVRGSGGPGVRGSEGPGAGYENAPAGDKPTGAVLRSKDEWCPQRARVGHERPVQGPVLPYSEESVMALVDTADQHLVECCSFVGFDVGLVSGHKCPLPRRHLLRGRTPSEGKPW